MLYPLAACCAPIHHSTTPSLQSSSEAYLLQLSRDPLAFAGDLGLNIQGQGLLEGRLALGLGFKLVLGHAEVVEEFAIVLAGLEALLEVLRRCGVVGATISHNAQDLREIRVIGEGLARFGEI